MDFMCPDTWISDVDFINILIKKLIINAVPFTDSISDFMYNALSRATGSSTECIMSA